MAKKFKTSAKKRAAQRARMAEKRKDPAFVEREREYMREWKRKNAEKKREQDSEYQKANALKIRIRRKIGGSINDKEVLEAAAMLEDHPGTCDICGGPGDGRWGSLNIDHCHETGQIRGLLCSACNRGLGYFKDSMALLEQAVRYLMEHGKDSS